MTISLLFIRRENRSFPKRKTKYLRKYDKRGVPNLFYVPGKNEKDKRQQDETSNIPLTGTKESDSVDSLGKLRLYVY